MLKPLDARQKARRNMQTKETDNMAIII